MEFQQSTDSVLDLFHFYVVDPVKEKNQSVAMTLEVQALGTT